MKWTELGQSGPLPLARSSHTITYVNGKAFLLGGEHKPRYLVHDPFRKFLSCRKNHILLASSDSAQIAPIEIEH